MFSVENQQIIKQNNHYLSFPDIIRSPHNPKTFFIVFREGDGHHPIWSNLVLMVSHDEGKTWDLVKKFRMNLNKDGCVWNCPRFYYNPYDGYLHIICDTKNDTDETKANFRVLDIRSKDDGQTFLTYATDMPGMVPDHPVLFKDRLYCANHKRSHGGMSQLVSWSRDHGRIWQDTNIMAHNVARLFCEASLVNISNQYLLAYIRENTSHVRHLYLSKSEDGIFWSTPEQLNVYGQRPSALLLDDNTVLVSFRNTSNVAISLMYHNLKDNTICVEDIDTEERSHMYHFGYTGIVKIDHERFYVVYYIQNDRNMPFIKLVSVKKNGENKKSDIFVSAKPKLAPFLDRLF